MKPQVLIFDHEASRYTEILAPLLPQLDFLPVTTADQAVAMGGKAQVLVALAPYIPARLVEAMPNLRWIQALTTGTDNLLTNMPALKPDVLITSVRGIHGPQMAELAFLYMLSLSRDLRGMIARQTSATWHRTPQRLLWSKCCVLVGTGAIAEELAHRCKAFGMNVTGISNHPRPIADFDEVLPRAGLRDAAARADFLIILLPYEASTENLIDANIIGAMKPDSVLINLSRGRIVDEEAVLAALESGAIRGAGLDVFATEPLPPENPFWHRDDVIVTPHIGGMSDIYTEQVLPTLIENFRAWLAGRVDQMRNVVRSAK
jgi:phosphoglycerate dehydrogenase-like enzyme